MLLLFTYSMALFYTCTAHTPESSCVGITPIHLGTHLLVCHLFMWEHAGVHSDTLGFFMKL